MSNARFVPSGKQGDTIIFTPPGAPKVTLTSDEAYAVWWQLGEALGELPPRPYDLDAVGEWLDDFIAERAVRR